jgi:Ca-activated chloride channel family protein
MMKFSEWKYLLSVVIWFPVLIFWVIYAARKREAFFKLFSNSQKDRIFNLNNRKLWTKRILIFTVLSLFTFALARPLMGGEEVNTKSEGIDIAVIFDVSLSMLAEDENGARYKKGKMMLTDVVDSLEGDRVSIIPFAGAAFLQLPLTDDYETVQTVVSVLEPGMIRKQGTALGTAFEMAAETLSSSTQESDKLIVVISDGEDPDLDFSGIKKLLTDNNIHVAVLPLGTQEGAPIRIGESYLKDEKGTTVVSKLERDFFEKCYSEFGAVEIKRGTTISSYVKNFKKSVLSEKRVVHIYTERFQIPLLIGIILFILYQLMSAAKRKEK